MRRLLQIVALILAVSRSGSAQWLIQDSHTSADLRGIHSIGNGIAWASGTNGTVLRTTDDGDHWQLCATPSGAEVLDFRGIQAFDANTAIVMSSGKGDLSRLYKTTDACHTWKLVFSNPDKDGFWDALRFSKPWPTGLSETSGVLIGDPVAGTFSVFLTSPHPTATAPPSPMTPPPRPGSPSAPTAPTSPPTTAATGAPSDPAPTEVPDADRDWNALSLPFVVGPKGRIGKLRTGANECPRKDFLQPR
jgi:hypothetical protein